MAIEQHLKLMGAPAPSQMNLHDKDQSVQDLLSSSSLYAILEAVADCTHALDGKARAFVDRSGNWLAGNDAAQQFFREAVSGIHFDRGRLVAPREWERSLQRLLAADGEVESCVVPAGDASEHAIFQAAAYNAAIVCITAVETSTDAAPQFVDLGAAFALTQCEEKVLRALLGGSPAQEVAEELNVSINTVRAHLRHCYEKMGVSHREELWRKAYPYRVY